MKHIKHLLATIAVLLCSITASAHDFEVGGIYYNITSKEDLTVEVTYKGDYSYQYTEYSKSITIPATVTCDGEEYSVTSIGNEAFAQCSWVTSITLPESVASIGYMAFYGCSRLTSITLPESVTSIGYNAFSSCSSLTSITLPERVTTIGDYAFSSCSSLTSINIPESVASIGYMVFFNCSSLTSIVVAEGNKVYDSRGGCNAIIETSSNTLIRGCSTITIPESVTSIGNGAFSGYRSLTSIVIPESVTSIGDYAFSNCSSLTSINIPESVTSIGDYAFFKCNSLTSIVIPESVTSIGDYAFSGCKGLTSITCEAITPPGIAFATFTDVNRNIPLYVPQASILAYQSANYWSEFTNIQAIPTIENITLTINEYGSATYCSEYALDFSEVEGLKAYVAAGYDSETGVVTLLRVKTAKAGIGLFVKGELGDYVVPVIENTSYNALNMLVGTLEDVTVNGTTDDGLYTNYKYAALDGDDEPKFYPFADGSTQKAGRAYLQIPTSWLTAATAKSISYRYDDGETTDIEEELSTFNSQFSIVYDLMGRRVENPTKGNIYIVNGKKVVY